MKNFLLISIFLLITLFSVNFSEARRSHTPRPAETVLLFPDTPYEMEVVIRGETGFLTADGVLIKIVEDIFDSSDLDPDLAELVEFDDGTYANCLGYIMGKEANVGRKEFELWLQENNYQPVEINCRGTVLSKWNRYGHLFRHDVDFVPQMWSGREGLQKEFYSNGLNIIIIYRKPCSLEIMHAGIFSGIR